MSVSVVGRHEGGLRFSMEQDGHSFMLDGDRKFGGVDAGPRPKNLLLSSLVGCTGMDVASILKKMKIKDYRLEITADGKYNDEHPVHFVDIHLTFRFFGNDLPRKKVEHAVELSQDKYCGVTYMLRQTADVSYSIVYEDDGERS